MFVRRTRRWAVVAAVALVAGMAAQPSQAAIAPDPGGSSADLRTPAQLGKHFGFSTDLGGWNSGVSATTEAQLIKKAGGTVQRFSANWASTQPLPVAVNLTPQSPTSSYPPDRLYLAALAQGLTPIITVLDAPNWAAGYPTSCYWLDLFCKGRLLSMKAHQPPQGWAIPYYALFVKGVAMRFPRAVIETWNEPNTSYYWASRTPDPVHMAKMQCAAYDAVKSVNPNQKVLAPGIGVAVTTLATYTAYIDYARAMYQTMGRICWDLLGVHTYFGIYFEGAGTVLAQMMEALRASRAAARDTSPIWVTETGVAISHTTTSGVQLWQQTSFHIQGLHKLLTIPEISAVVVHTLRDGGTIASYNQPRHQDYGMGILTQSLGAKPGYCHWVKLSGNSYLNC